MASKASPGKDSFEELYRALEETVAKLEAGGLSLQETISLYEEGMRLALRCRELLEQAELRISRLQEEFATYNEGLGAVREGEAIYTPAEEPPDE